MTNPVIGYQDQFDLATVTTSSDPAAAPKENGINWNTFDFWQPAAATQNWLEFDFGVSVDVSYIAIYSSDFYTMTGAEIEVVSGASPTPTTVLMTESIDSIGPKMFDVRSGGSPTSARYWRVRLNTTGSETPKIQIIKFGVILELEQGLRPGWQSPEMASKNKGVNSVSANGLFLGRSVAIQPISFKLPLTVLTPTWLRANWPGLRDHLDSKPMFLLPEPDVNADGAESVYCWTTGKAITPIYSHSNLESLTLNLEGFRG